MEQQSIFIEGKYEKGFGLMDVSIAHSRQMAMFVCLDLFKECTSTFLTIESLDTF